MTYLANIECSNCGYSGSLEIPKGLKVEEMPCPDCHSKSLVLAPKEEIEKEEHTSPQE